MVFGPLFLFYYYQGLCLGRMLPCLALLFSTWSQLVLSLKGGGALAEVESSETLTWLSEMASQSFPSASVHLVSHPLLPELK